MDSAEKPLARIIQITRKMNDGLSIEMEPWRSEGIRASYFIVMFGARHNV